MIHHVFFFFLNLIPFEVFYKAGPSCDGSQRLLLFDIISGYTAFVDDKTMTH